MTEAEVEGEGEVLEEDEGHGVGLTEGLQTGLLILTKGE